jgi:hypothetical protein
VRSESGKEPRAGAMALACEEEKWERVSSTTLSRGDKPSAG